MMIHSLEYTEMVFPEDSEKFGRFRMMGEGANNIEPDSKELRTFSPTDMFKGSKAVTKKVARLLISALYQNKEIIHPEFSEIMWVLAAWAKDTDHKVEFQKQKNSYTAKLWKPQEE